MKLSCYPLMLYCHKMARWTVCIKCIFHDCWSVNPSSCWKTINSMRARMCFIDIWLDFLILRCGNWPKPKHTEPDPPDLSCSTDDLRDPGRWEVEPNQAFCGGQVSPLCVFSFIRILDHFYPWNSCFTICICFSVFSECLCETAL